MNRLVRAVALTLTLAVTLFGPLASVAESARMSPQASGAQSTTPPPPPPKNSEGPLNTHSRAGVRGGVGHPVVVRVQLSGAAVGGAHITVTDADGKIVGVGDTGNSGVWTLSLAAGGYTFTVVTADGARKASLTQDVEDSTHLVTVELTAASEI